MKTHPTEGRKIARGLYKIDKCERCDSNATEIHHVDKNTFNNDRSNLMFLCRSCHMTVDGRLEALRKTHHKKPPTECNNCLKLSKPLRKGLCHSCNEYLRRNNKPKPNLIHGKHKITKDKLELMKICRKMGMPYREVSKIVGLNRNTIARAIKSCHEKEHKP